MPHATPKTTHPFRQYRYRYAPIDEALAKELATHHEHMKEKIRGTSEFSAAEIQTLQAKIADYVKDHRGKPPVLFVRTALEEADDEPRG